MVQIKTYYFLGKWIVEVQQNGEKRAKPLLLSWSHYLQLMRIENEDENLLLCNCRKNCGSGFQKRRSK